MDKMEKSEQVLSWHRILQLLVHAVKLYPHASTAMVSHKSSVSADDHDHCQWSDISELWFLAMQGLKTNEFLSMIMFCCFFFPELTALVTHSQQFGADLFQVASEGSVLQQFADALRALVQFQSSEWKFTFLTKYNSLWFIVSFTCS